MIKRINDDWNVFFHLSTTQQPNSVTSEWWQLTRLRNAFIFAEAFIESLGGNYLVICGLGSVHDPLGSHGRLLPSSIIYIRGK